VRRQARRLEVRQGRQDGEQARLIREPEGLFRAGAVAEVVALAMPGHLRPQPGPKT
jgi:hypothetical protein